MDDGRTGRMTVGRPGRSGGQEMSKAHLQMTDLVSGGGVAAARRWAEGAGQVAAEMMGLALAISTCTAPPMRNVSNEKHGNLLSFGVQRDGEWLRSLAPMGGTTSLVYLGVRKDGRSGPDYSVSWAVGTEIQLTFISSPTNPPRSETARAHSLLSLLAQMKERLNIGNRCRFAFLA